MTNYQVKIVIGDGPKSMASQKVTIQTQRRSNDVNRSDSTSSDSNLRVKCVRVQTNPIHVMKMKPVDQAPRPSLFHCSSMLLTAKLAALILLLDGLQVVAQSSSSISK